MQVLDGLAEHFHEVTRDDSILLNFGSAGVCLRTAMVRNKRYHIKPPKQKKRVVLKGLRQSILRTQGFSLFKKQSHRTRFISKTITVEMNGNGEHKIKVKSPVSLAHIVFRTANFSGMIDFWQTFLGAEITYKGEGIAFLRYDDEHHRIAIISMPNLGPKQTKAAGLDHVAFSYETLSDLAETYLQRKSLGIQPTWCVNHGPTTSMYYRDPDGNTIETQVDNYESPEEANAFMKSKYFAENPIGTDFDADEFVKRLRAGEDESAIKARPEIGPRGLPADF